MRLRLVVCLFLLMSIPLFVYAQDNKQALNDKFYEATRAGNVAEVKSLLDQGADVNAKFRYGATALFKAAERGHAEVVRLLLERGADPTIKDTFYGATAMTWALQNDRVEVVRVLLEKDKGSVDAVLSIGAQQRKAELVRVALAAGGSSPDSLTDALVTVSSGQSENPEIAQLLKKAGAVPPPQIAPEVLQTYVGKYKSEGGIEVVISMREQTLFGSQGGSRPFQFRPVDQVTFKPVGVEGITLTFKVEGTAVKGLASKQGPTTTEFKRIDEGK